MEMEYKVEIPKTVLKKEFSLALAEKPTAARRIANAISDTKPKKNLIKVRNLTYDEKLQDIEIYTCSFQEETIIVVSALGHLFTLIQNGNGWTYPTYDFKWVPAYQAKKKRTKVSKHEKRMEATVEAIRQLAQAAKRLIIMTDYDQEGEVIGGVTFNSVLQPNSLSNIYRMRFSSLTKDELRKSMERTLLTPLPNSGMDMGMYNRGLMRHYLDWLWGINLSRALILSLKNAVGRYQTLSVGRVQGPTLGFVAKRMEEIDTFVPIPFFQLDAQIMIDETIFSIEYSVSQIQSEREAIDLVQKNQDKMAKVSNIEVSTRKVHSPPPYNLSDLQRDAYRYFRITPRRTLDAAERLYLAASISYPRTSSQKYPPNTDHKSILQNLSKQSRFADFRPLIKKILNKKPKEGEKTDPAHPAIHPTGQPPSKLTGDAEKIYDLIVKRYFATFGSSATVEDTKATFEIKSLQFSLTGRRIIDNGWWDLFAPYGRPNFTPLPKITIGQTCPVVKLGYVNKFTSPPPHYNEASLLREMEKAEIGTKATRAEIIQTLINRKYVTTAPIKITRLGQIVYEVLSDYSPQVLSVTLSREIERMGDRIEQTINNTLTNGKSLTLNDAILQGIEILHNILSDLQQNEIEIGTIIDRELTEQNREALILAPCKSCKTGNLQIINSRTTNKRFIGCSSYFEDKSCTVTFPLPQRGNILQTGKECDYCGLPLLKILNGKRPWIFCPDIECERNNQDNSAEK